MNRKVEAKNSVTMLIISILTCGIGALYWLYTLVNDICALDEKPESGAMDLVLSIVTCGIYLIYLNYRMGNDIDRLKQERGMNSNNTGILCLVLSIFGFSVVSYLILQNAVNELA